jgi:hypothetical protein
MGHHPVAARKQGLAQEEVRCPVLLAAYQERGRERGLVAGGAASSRSARGVQVLLEQLAGHDSSGETGGV